MFLLTIVWLFILYFTCYLHNAQYTFVYLIYTVDFDDDYLWIYGVSEAPEENVGRV